MDIRIVTSTNEDLTYLDFWKLQSLSNKVFFPKFKLCIAFLTNRNYDDSLIKEMVDNGIEVKIYTPLNYVPEPNLSKIIRYLYASEFESDICTVTDMDTIPLQSDYLNKVLSHVEKDKILSVGKEVLINTPDSGKFPAHHTSGFGNMFKKLYNPNNLEFEECVKSLIGINIFHNRENITNSPKDFSDESLNRALIFKNKIDVKDITRDINIYEDWVDRSWWNLNVEKLNSGKYIEANLLRPLKDNYDKIKPIEQYILKCQKN